MDTNLLFNLFLNLAGAGFLFMFAKWFIKYDMAWWLRDRRGVGAMKTMRDFAYLKIKLPRDVFKTPAAMELVLITLNQSLGHANFPLLPKVVWRGFSEMDHHSHKTKYHIQPFQFHNFDDKPDKFYKWIQGIKTRWLLKYMNGSLRSWSSLEIISDAGEIYFLVVTKTNNKELFKQYAYSQFPGIEIIEEKEDPLNKFTYTDQKTGESQIYVGRYATDKDKDHLPIKTYVDYGLDKEMVKDEFKIDPLVVLLEAMSQAKKGEMYWFQILIRPTIYTKSGDLSAHPYDWAGETQKQIDKIMQVKRAEADDEPVKGVKKGEIYEVKRGLLSLTQTEKHQVEIMQRNLEKPGFDCILKMFYWIDRKIYPEGLNSEKIARGVMTVVNAPKTFNKPGYNSFGFGTITTDSDTPFLDPDGSWTERKRKDFWKKGKLRAAFYQEAPGVEFEWSFFSKMWQRYRVANNWDTASGLWGEIKEYWLHPGEYPHRDDGYSNGHGFVLNAEELATLWHFPGKAFGGNAESKVGSVKADPPSNLPI